MLKFREVVFIFIYVLITLMGLTLIKMGAQGEGKVIMHILGIDVGPKLITGIICYGFSFLMYVIVISRMQLSLAIPVAGAINSIGIVIIGLTVFHEHLQVGQAIGAAIVVVGVLVIGIFSR